MQIPSVAIVGSDSLLGKEVREVLRDRALPYRLQFIGADDEEGVAPNEEDDDEIVITGLDETHLITADAVMLAGTAESSRQVWSLLAGSREKLVIDVARTLEDIPSSRLMAPILGDREPGNPAIVAHPAAVALAMFFSKLEELPIRHTVIDIFEPASERGKRGIGELHQQAVKLFSFQGLPKNVYDAQLAFNMLARFGPEAPLSLEQIESSIERHLVSLLSGSSVPMPSIRLIQAPVFHGYSFSIWAELETDVSKENLATALFAEEDAPDNVGVAGENGISIGGIRADRDHPRAYWIWMAADNLRLCASNAVQILEQVCTV